MEDLYEISLIYLLKLIIILTHYKSPPLCNTDVETIAKFAQMEFKHGEPERGKTMFENILSNYPKRTDLWSVYVDMVIKTDDIEAVRYI